MRNKKNYMAMAVILFLPLAIQAQIDCNGPTEKIVGAKGSTFTIPCKDMVLLDIATYSKYRYIEKQFHSMDSTVLGYTNRLDSLDKENARNKALLEEKIKNKEETIAQYKNHAQEITTVLEKCKADSEGFVKAYQEKIDQNKKLEEQVTRVKNQRKGLLGISGGLAAALILVLLL